MPGIAVFAAQHMTVYAKANADAGAPGDISAMRHTLQRAPAALGFQRGNAVVLDPHAGKGFAQRRFQRRTGPVIGQTPPCASQATADVRGGQRYAAVLQHEGAARRHAHSGNVSRGNFGLGAALANHAQDLARQRVRLALLDGGLFKPADHAACVHHIDRHLGSANVHTGHGWRSRRKVRLGAAGLQWHGISHG